jgi:peptidoglycan/LPS O-acetylase OafA/YrhL
MHNNNSVIFYKLESLRGIAACLVVLLHSSFTFGEASIAFVNNSYLFVDFFFILSGFVMALSFSKKIQNGLPFSAYFILRLGRIYPLHIFMLIVVVPYVIAKQYFYTQGFGGTDQYFDNNVSTFLSNVILIHSMGLHDNLSWNSPSWSISVEFFTYIAFYLLSLSLDSKKSLFTPLIFSIICYGILVSLGRQNLDITYDYGFFRCLGAFYIGVFIFRVKKYEFLNRNICKNINMCEISSVTIAVIGVTLAAEHRLGWVFPIVSFSLVILIFSNQRNGIIGYILNTNMLKKIGVWSYSIYMIHWIVLSISSNVTDVILQYPLKGLGLYSVVLNIINLTIIILLSRFTYQYIENPFRRLTKQAVLNRHPPILQKRNDQSE